MTKVETKCLNLKIVDQSDGQIVENLFWKTEIFEIHALNFVTQFDILPQTQVMSTILPKSSNLRAVGYD